MEDGGQRQKRSAGVELRLEAELLVVELSGWRRVLALQRRVAVQLDSIVSVVHDPTPRRRIATGLRPTRRQEPGGLLRYGTYHGPDGWSFWAIGTGARAVVVETSAGRYRFIVVEVPDPAATVEEIDRRRPRTDAFPAHPGRSRPAPPRRDRGAPRGDVEPGGRTRNRARRDPETGRRRTSERPAIPREGRPATAPEPETGRRRTSPAVPPESHAGPRPSPPGRPSPRQAPPSGPGGSSDGNRNVE